MLHGFQHVPHGFQLLCGQVRKAGVPHLDNLAESTGHIVTAQKGRVHNHIAILGDLLILLLQILERHRPVRRRTRLLVNAFLRHGVQRKGPCIGAALPIDAFQHLCHGGTHILRNVLVVRGPQQLLRQCAGMAGDLCPQLSPLLIVPPGHVLLPVTLLQRLHLLRPPGTLLCQCLRRTAQPLCIPFALRHLTGQKSVICRLPALESGFLHLLRRPIRKGFFRLGQVKEPVHDVIGDRRHGLSHVAFKGVVLRHVVQPVRHVRDPLHLVGDVGLLRLVEKLRILAGKLGIDLVNVGVLAPADFQLAEQALAELVEVRDLGGVRFRQRQFCVFQILPQPSVFLVCPVIHFHGAFRDPLCNGIRPSPRLGVGQLVLTVFTAGNVVIQALQVSGNVAAADLRAVILYQRVRRLLNGFPVGGHALRPSGLALPVLHPLFQGLVLPFQRRDLLRVLRAFQRQELRHLRNARRCPVFEIRFDVIQHLAGMGPSGVLRAGNRLPIRGVQIKNDFAPVFTDKV